MESWHSYPGIYNLGHKAVDDLLSGPVLVEEKVDGSQFSFGVTEDGEIRVRSKGATMLVDAPEGMFIRAVATVKELAPRLHPGWTYRAEYLRSPKHNALVYDRVPRQHLIIFDVNTGHESYLDYDAKAAEADRLGLEVVPVLYQGMVATLDQFRGFLDTVSVLGGQKIEGVVIKPVGYGLFGLDKKALLGKFVSEAFKETHAHAWKEANPKSGDIIEIIAGAHTTQARWMKAIQHLRESGKIEDSPKDIGLLVREIPEDIMRECEADIRDALFAWAWPHIRRKVTAGMPEWYKEQLLHQQFAQEADAPVQS